MSLFFWQHQIFVALLGLALAVVEGRAGGCSSLERMDFSLGWLLLLRSSLSGVRASAQQHAGQYLWCAGSGHTGFTGCGVCAQGLRSLWNLFGPGIEPVSPASAGAFLPTEPPTKFPMSFKRREKIPKSFPPLKHHLLSETCSGHALEVANPTQSGCSQHPFLLCCFP